MALPSAFNNNMNSMPKQKPKKDKGCKITTKQQNGKTVKSIEGNCTKQELEALKNNGSTESPES